MMTEEPLGWNSVMLLCNKHQVGGLNVCMSSVMVLESHKP